MIELRRICLVSWHTFEREDIEMIANASVIGKNRTGKTTILDAIQVVLAGASHSSFELNKAANDGGPRDRSVPRRSVHGYCLANLGGSIGYLRASSHTYIALGFEDVEKKRAAVTIGLALTATKDDQRENLVARFVAQGVLLSTADFVKAVGDEEEVLPWREARRGILERHGAGVSIAEFNDAARDFMREYMRLLFPSRRRIESPEQFMKAFVMGISFSEVNIQSASDFVRKRVLQESNLQIKELRQSIKTYRDIKDTIDALILQLADLREIETDIASYSHAVHAYQTEQWVIAFGALMHSLTARKKFREQLRKTQATIQSLKEEEANERREVERLEPELEAALSVYGPDQVRETELRKAVDSYIAQATTKRRSLDALRQHLSITVNALRADHRLDLPVDLQDDVTRLQKLLVKTGTSATDTDLADLDTVARRLVSGLAKVDDMIVPALAAVREQVAELRGSINSLRAERARIVDQGDVLGTNTRAFCDRLQSMGMRPEVVCEQIDIIDETWRDAAEVLLGRFREAIYVAPEHTEEATDLLRRERQRYRFVRVVYRQKLDESRHIPSPGTLAAIIRGKTNVAMAYIVARIGNVRLGYRVEDLRQQGRVVLADCTYNDGLDSEVLEVRDRKIGTRSQALEVERLDRVLRQKAEALRPLEQREQLLQSIVEKLRDVRQQDWPEVSLLELARAIIALNRDVREAQATIRELETQRSGEESDDLKKLKKDLNGARGRLEAKGKALTRAEEAEKTAQQQLDPLHDAEVPGSLLNIRRSKIEYAKLRGFLTFADGGTSYRARLAPRRTHQAITDEARERFAIMRGAMEAAEAAARRRVNEFFRKRTLPSPFTEEDRLTREILAWARADIARIETNALIEHQARADEAARKAAYYFRVEFVNELRERFSLVERELRSLNASLADHVLNKERFSFHREILPGFRRLQTLVEMADVDDRIFTAVFHSQPSPGSQEVEVVREISDILLSDNFDISTYEDYRNYFSFRLQFTNVVNGSVDDWEKRRGTASGAEKQAPFYVAIGAALAAIYFRGLTRVPGQGHDGMALAVFDEAFSSMDADNRNTTFQFFRQLGIQVIVAGPIELKRVFLGHITTQIETLRNERTNLTTTETTYYKDKVRAAIVEIDPSQRRLEAAE
jgi:hypothetical protein